MDGNKILEVIGSYRKYFEEKGISKIEISPLQRYPTRRHILNHCHWMLDSMETFLKEGGPSNTEKLHRWLGFIQGCLWSECQYTLSELRDHNR